MKGIEAWTQKSAKIVSCRCRASTSRSCLSSSSSSSSSSGLQTLGYWIFIVGKTKQKQEKKNTNKIKQNKTDRTRLWRSKRHTCLRKAAQLKRPSPTDSPLEKVHHLSPPGVHTCPQTRQCLFLGGEVGFRLIMFRHLQRNFFVGI
jgi:hypothetical protein